jgi:hypothetical protein
MPITNSAPAQFRAKNRKLEQDVSGTPGSASNGEESDVREGEEVEE